MASAHNKEDLSTDSLSDQEAQKEDEGRRSRIKTLFRSFSLKRLGEKAMPILAFCSKITGFLWSLLPQMLVDIIVVFAMYITSSLLLKASEAISLALWSTGKNPFYTPIVSLRGQPITPASSLEFFVQLWLVVSLALSLVVNTYRLIRVGHQSSEDAK
jgi:hypothetical protein